jgi:hypothetical protein
MKKPRRPCVDVSETVLRDGAMFASGSAVRRGETIYQAIGRNLKWVQRLRADRTTPSSPS